MSADNLYVQLLKGARRRIENHGEDHVCCAIGLESQSRGLGYDTGPAGKLRTWIAGSLRPHATLGGWLDDQGVTWDAEGIRAHRLAWIDRMIKEWKDAK